MLTQSEAKIHDQEGSSWCQMVEDYYEMELSGEECDKDAEVVENTAFGLRIMRPIVIKEILEGFCITYHHEHEEMEDASVQNRLICRAMAIGFGWKNQVYHLDGTMLFSRMESRRRTLRMTPMEITAAGMDADTVMPTRSPRYAFAPPKMMASKAPSRMDTAVNSGMTLSAGT